MVIARLHPDRGRNAGLAAGHHQQTGLELFVQKIVGIALIDQQIGQAGAVLDQRAGIVRAPGGLVRAKVTDELYDLILFTSHSFAQFVHDF